MARQGRRTDPATEAAGVRRSRSEEIPVRAIEYAAPDSIDEAVALLRDYGSRARVLAGGTDLIVQVRENLREVDLFVDAKGVEELMETSFDPARGLTLGAAVPCHEIYANPTVLER